MAGRQDGMIEIARSVADQTDALHHPARAVIVRYRISDDFRQAQGGKAEIQRGGGGLGGIAVAPMATTQAPGHFHRLALGGERHGLGRLVQPDIADERAAALHFHRPQTPAAGGQIIHDAQALSVALTAIQC